MTPEEFVKNWQNIDLSERASYQRHFIDLCAVLGVPAPRDRDEKGKIYQFEYGVKKDTGTQGFADVFYEEHFAVEYKAPGGHASLDAAYSQLQQYRGNLKNPPLLVVTDIDRWIIRTGWTGYVTETIEFTHEQVPQKLDILRAMFTDPRILHPGRTTQKVTEDAANIFQRITSKIRKDDELTGIKTSPERIAHFLSKIIFCLFAEDVNLLPPGPKGEDGIFTEILKLVNRSSEKFVRNMRLLFDAMAHGGEVMAQDIPYFNGSLFENVDVEPLQLEALTELEKASLLNWASVDPTVFGTLFERVLDPKKRSQLGAHYTGIIDIQEIVQPVLMRPLMREWEQTQQTAHPVREKYDAATDPRTRQRHERELYMLRDAMLDKVQSTRVLDPACGSGNFLYVALRELKDLEKEIVFHPVFVDLPHRPFLTVDPTQLYGIETDPIAHALASIVVWIGYIQWHYENGIPASGNPILKPIHGNIRCMDAIMSPLHAKRGGVGGGDTLHSSHTEDRQGVGNISAPLAHTRTTPDLWEKIKPFAREMRKEPTPAEDVLWQKLRGKHLGGYKFRRQHPVDRFIVDFFCPGAKLAVEVDGAVHDTQQEYDALRQEFIESLGIRVIRFRNEDVLTNVQGVLEVIGEVLSSPPPPLPASHGGAFEPDWPEVDVIIGNPPFLGGKRQRGQLGDTYMNTLFKLYDGRVLPDSDLVCYWHEKARAHIEAGKARRAGLLSTNSIRGGVNREVLKRIKDSGNIFMAWADREWVLEGAAVRISMVGFDDGSEAEKSLDGKPVADITPDLTGGLDLTAAQTLKENAAIAYMGVTPGAKFDIEEKTAREMLIMPNASGKANSSVVKPYYNAMDIVQNLRRMWTIDFGTELAENEAAEYEKPFEYLKNNVLPERLKSRQTEREKALWWRYTRSRPEMRNALTPLSRYIATPMVAKHRIFVWLEKHIVPANLINVIARDDDYFFGVLHSKLHEVWSLRMGTWLGVGNDPRYTPTTTFETFPFPWSPGSEDTAAGTYQAIAAAAKQLHEERQAWLTPLHAKRGGVGGGEKDRTLTNLYNALNVFRGKEKISIKPAAGDFAPRLDVLHTTLDKAVCDAYAWEHAILTDEDEILRRLLALNLARAAKT